MGLSESYGSDSPSESDSLDQSETSSDSEDLNDVLQQVRNRLLTITGEDETPAGGKREDRKVKEAKKKAKKQAKKATKAKRLVRKLKSKLRRFKQHSEMPKNPHEDGLNDAELLHKDLTLIPRKKLR